MEKADGKQKSPGFIRGRVVPAWAVIAALYLSFCFSGFFTARGVLALIGLGNDVSSFFLGGILPCALSELFGLFLYRKSQTRLGCRNAALRYAVRYFIIAANLAAGACKLLYLAFPVLFPFGERLFSLVFNLAALVLYLLYAVRTYYERPQYGGVIGYLGGWYLGLFALLILIKLFSGATI